MVVDTPADDASGSDDLDASESSTGEFESDGPPPFRLTKSQSSKKKPSRNQDTQNACSSGPAPSTSQRKKKSGTLRTVAFAPLTEETAPASRRTGLIVMDREDRELIRERQVAAECHQQEVEVAALDRDRWV